MKTTQEKIQYVDLLNCYSQQQLLNYRNNPHILAAEMKDLDTISQLLQTQFAEKVVVAAY